MSRKDEFLGTHPDVRTGMDVCNLDGEKLGEIERLDEDNILVEKGWLFPRDFSVRYDDVVDIRKDCLVIAEDRTNVPDDRDEGYSSMG